MLLLKQARASCQHPGWVDYKYLVTVSLKSVLLTKQTMKRFYRLSIAFCLINLHHANAKKCLTGSGTDYTGDQDTTKDGRPCQRWDINYPNVVNHRPQGNFKHNYCRNPDNDSNGPWCYFADFDRNSETRNFNYCDIPECRPNCDPRPVSLASLGAGPTELECGHRCRNIDYSSRYDYAPGEIDHKRCANTDHKSHVHRPKTKVTFE